MRRFTQVLGLAAVISASAAAALAAPSISVGLHETRRIMLSGDAANVVVSDPKVADVNMIDSHSVLVSGRGFGATQILATDEAGRVLIDSVVNVTPPNDQSHVTVFRGADLTEYACPAGQCRKSDDAESESGSGSGGADATAGAQTPPPSHP